MHRHQWFQLPDNPRVMHSEPVGWLIMKHAQWDYSLHLSESGDVKPFSTGRDWQALAEIADKATSYGKT